jgi:hypothetical protein
MRARCPLLLTTVALLTTGVAHAQDPDSLPPWQQQLVRQIELLDERLVENGYAAADVRAGLVDAGTNATVHLDLEPGSYMVAAVCDNDCSDLDLAVAHAGETLARDILDDDVPIVDFDVTATSGYVFTVSMVRCQTASCGYGLVVYRKTGPGGVDVPLEELDELEEWQQQVARQLLALDRQLTVEGLTATHLEADLVAAGGTDRVTLDFEDGSYVAAAVCDNDCSDVDLVVYDVAGNTLDEDLLVDDAPVVEFFGPGRYQFEVRMVDCDTPTCGYALRVYRKGPGSAW